MNPYLDKPLTRFLECARWPSPAVARRDGNSHADALAHESSSLFTEGVSPPGGSHGRFSRPTTHSDPNA